MSNETKQEELVELKEYKIISKYFKNKDGDNDINSLIYLPTPESLEKLSNSHLVKDVMNFDLKIYESFFTPIIDENDDNTVIAFNLDKIDYIMNRDILSFLLSFSGAIN